MLYVSVLPAGSLFINVNPLLLFRKGKGFQDFPSAIIFLSVYICMYLYIKSVQQKGRKGWREKYPVNLGNITRQ